jgi:hypothetical protein
VVVNPVTTLASLPSASMVPPTLSSRHNGTGVGPAEVAAGSGLLGS